MNLTLVTLALDITLTAPARGMTAPFAVRTFFPAAFKRAVMHLGEPSWWEADFGQQLSPDPEAVRRYQKPPLPFVFDLPVFQAGQTGHMTIGLTLVGSAVNHLPAYIHALRLLFADSVFLDGFPARLNAIAALDATESKAVLWHEGGEPQLSSIPLIGSSQLIDRKPASPGTLLLEVRTPLRLMQQGRACREPGFSVLARTLMRRVTAMAYYYGEEELAAEFKWLAERSGTVETVRSDLRWQEWGGGVQGVTGRIAFAGDLEEFMPFFLLGERLHAGKGASYGMGRYLILDGGL